MKTHVFRSARYRIVETDRIKRDGYCDWRHKKDKKLWVKKSLPDEKRLESSSMRDFMPVFPMPMNIPWRRRPKT